jgi:hypothetical protein
MEVPSEPRPIREWTGVTPDLFHSEIRPLGQPAVFRGLKRDWPLVRAGLQSGQAVVDYLSGFYSDKPIGTLTVPPSEKGRIFYNRDMNGYNFGRSMENLRNVLRGILKVQGKSDAPAIAMQAIEAPEFLPGFEAEQPMELAPAAPAKLWIGNAAHVAPHYDLKENIACVAVGRRRFTLFPPEQLPNLYVGPLDNTPAGAPISLVQVADPDLETYPRYAEALSAAQFAELDPGDVIYIPYMWWHGVQALESFNILVNYWWNDHEARSEVHPSSVLALAWLAFMDMPPEHRKRWRDMFDHYIFSDGAMDHLPPHARGMMGDLNEQQIVQIRQMLARALINPQKIG